MALSFSANQYQDAFVPKRLQNHEVPKEHRERPRALDGFTQIIGTNRGHLRHGVPKSQNNPWGKFVGTWDLPKRIPGNCTTLATARNDYSQKKLTVEFNSANKVLSGNVKNHNRILAKKGLDPTSPKKRVSLHVSSMKPESKTKTYPGSKTIYPTPDDLVNLTPTSPTPELENGKTGASPCPLRVERSGAQGPTPCEANQQAEPKPPTPQQDLSACPGKPTGPARLPTPQAQKTPSPKPRTPTPVEDNARQVAAPQRTPTPCTPLVPKPATPQNEKQVVHGVW